MTMASGGAPVADPSEQGQAQPPSTECATDADCRRFAPQPLCIEGVCVESGLGPAGGLFGTPPTHPPPFNAHSTGRLDLETACAVEPDAAQRRDGDGQSEDRTDHVRPFRPGEAGVHLALRHLRTLRRGVETGPAETGGGTPAAGARSTRSRPLPAPPRATTLPAMATYATSLTRPGLRGIRQKLITGEIPAIATEYRVKRGEDDWITIGVNGYATADPMTLDIWEGQFLSLIHI